MLDNFPIVVYTVGMKTYTGKEILTVPKSGWFWCKDPSQRDVEPIWVQVGDTKIVLDKGYRREVYIFLDPSKESDYYADSTIYGPIEVPAF